MKLFAAVLVSLVLAAPAAASWSFGRTGGNIRPFTVTISAGGAVTANGATVGRTKLTAVQLRAVASAFKAVASLPASTLCPHTLPDVAAQFLANGAKRVSVHGGCSASFTSTWNALAATVKLG
ncbi:MAG: hypothetical protein JO186_05375 [Actinobacteria bacterium]|nr:hypothetical protein [Actinomycetota bacterium]MBV8396780.1 hypothetical protein [Actinomycetota bacterium]MBV8598980.1 hypothetical protein [Actinomycetota bacterium]